ncbi:MAG: flagellar motor protein MotB [Bythopirellula sp.]|nr:flagellar motor protein MotB [Bythopirellula sp.]
MAGAGGGAWKVAYADFVTAMMAFFMVMWLTSQKPDVKQSVAQYFRDPFAIESDDPPSRGYGSEEDPPKKDGRYSPTVQKRKDGRGQPGKMRNGFAAAQYNDAPQITVLFKDGTAEMDSEQLDHLKHSVSNLLGRRNRIEIRAHSLRRPLPPESPYKNHWELCYARCNTVMEVLAELGMDPDLIRLSQAEGNEPMAESLDKSELQFNSRVDVHVLPEIVDSQQLASNTK